MKDVAVDACCLINLLAAGTIFPDPPPSQAKGRASMPKGATTALECTLRVPGVVTNESLYLLQPDDDDESKLVKTPIDLTPLFGAGVLVECDVEGEEETNLFVQFAAALDDGEAACMAIAKNRAWTLATDDRPATRLAGQFNVPVVTTAELVKDWAKKSKAKKAEITRTLLNIQQFAKFVPRQNSPEAQWWFSHVSQK
jgi:hypothetical protein